MRKIHVIMQAKGGVGKSFIATMLAQYLIGQKPDLLMLDTDPSNQTFFSTKGLDIEFIDLMSSDNYQVQIEKFDRMYQLIIDAAPKDVLIDSGASSYIQLFSYLTHDYAATLLKEDNCQLIVHVPVMGGESRAICFEKLYEMTKNIPDAKFVLWLNNYPKKVFLDTDEDNIEKEFNWQKSKSRVSAIVELPIFHEGTFGKVLKLMMDNHKLFVEVLNPSVAVKLGDVPVTNLERFRLKIIKQKLWEAISVIDEILIGD